MFAAVCAPIVLIMGNYYMNYLIKSTYLNAEIKLNTLLDIVTVDKMHYAGNMLDAFIISCLLNYCTSN